MAEEVESAHGGDDDASLPMNQKVGIVMGALGEEGSGEVMKHLGDFEIEEITGSIAALKNISVDVIDQVLEEFESPLMAGEWISQGGIDFARAALARALGPRRAQPRSRSRQGASLPPPCLA